MQKVVKFLESYVQWLALGLAVLWMGWVAYAYWVNPPVSIDIGNRPKLEPGEVDEQIAAPGGPIDSLKKALNNELKAPPEVANVFGGEGPQYVAAFKKQINLEGVELAAIPAVFPIPEAPVGPETGGPKLVATTKPVLMAIAPGTIIKPQAQPGLSVVLKPDPTVVINANNPPQAVWNNPLNPNAKPVAIVEKECNWITVSATVVMSALYDAMKQADLTDDAAYTQYLKVRLVRQELQPDGHTWGPDEVISELANQAKPNWEPKPAEEVAYVQWASPSTPDIVRPLFYEVVRGNLWHTASTDEPIDPNRQQQPAVAETTFDPANPPKDREWTGAERKMVQEYQENKRKEEAEARKSRMPPPRSPTPGGGRNTGPGGRGGSYAPPPRGEEPIIPRGQPGSGYQRRGYPPQRNAYPPPGREGVVPSRVPATTQPGLTPQDLNNPADVPPGRFTPAPAAALKDLEIWAHDETTIPGHTYRYKLEVYFMNPLYGTVNQAANPADAQKLYVKGESPWTAPIMSLRKQAFFVADGGTSIGNTPKMKFEYFWWEDGFWKYKPVSLQPGDQMPNTPWTMFDVRPVGNSSGDNKALLVSNTGETMIRFYKTDMKDPAYIKLNNMVKGAPAAPPVLGGPAVGATGS